MQKGNEESVSPEEAASWEAIVSPQEDYDGMYGPQNGVESNVQPVGGVGGMGNHHELNGAETSHELGGP
jgi:hypothetical protein